MKCNQLIRILIRDGWYVIRQKGSHIKMKHPVKKGTLIVPDHGSKEMAKGTEISLLKQAGIV